MDWALASKEEHNIRTKLSFLSILISQIRSIFALLICAKSDQSLDTLPQHEHVCDFCHKIPPEISPLYSVTKRHLRPSKSAGTDFATCIAREILGGIMKKSYTLQKYLLGIGSLLGLMATMETAQASDWGVGLSLNYSSGQGHRGGHGHHHGGSMFGYGNSQRSLGAINGCFNGGGGYRGGGGPWFPGRAGGPFIGHGRGGGGGGYVGRMPQPRIPPMPPLIPPHAGGGPIFGQNGGGYHGRPVPMPGPGYPMPRGPIWSGQASGGCQTICGGGVPAAYGPPPYMGPVAGGPMMHGHGGGHGMAHGGGRQIASSGGGANIYSIYGGGTTVIDMRSKNAWEVNDTADIMWSTALGLGMTTTNVFPFTGPRNSYTRLNLMYRDGDRDTYLQPRPHAAP